MYTLYYMPGSCSMAIHVLLNELGQEVRLVSANTEGTQNRSPEFLKINPRGSVPVLVDGDTIVREGAAIIMYLTEKHPGALMPTSGKDRAKAVEWLMFCNATMHPAYGRAFFAMKNFTGADQEKFVRMAVELINKHWVELEAHLANSDYLCGKEMTVADILLTVIANWSPRIAGIELGPNAKRLFKNVSARPAYRKALEVEKVEYKAAA